jgi:cytochrome b-561
MIKLPLGSSMVRVILFIAFAFLMVACAAPYSSAGSGETPLTLGEALYRAVVGGPAISEATLLRFYAWHVMALSIPMLVLIAWHGFRVRRDGGISSPERTAPEEHLEKLDRAVAIRRETLTFFITIAVLIVISVFVEVPIGPAAEIGALTEHSKAPWIFLWVQELLRIWPPAIAGVLTPIMVILLLALLPYMDWSNDGIAVWFNRQGRITQIVLVVLFLVVVGLTIRAALR